MTSDSSDIYMYIAYHFNTRRLLLKVGDTQNPNQVYSSMLQLILMLET